MSRYLETTPWNWELFEKNYKKSKNNVLEQERIRDDEEIMIETHFYDLLSYFFDIKSDFNSDICLYLHFSDRRDDYHPVYTINTYKELLEIIDILENKYRYHSEHMDETILLIRGFLENEETKDYSMKLHKLILDIDAMLGTEREESDQQTLRKIQDYIDSFIYEQNGESKIVFEDGDTV